jgi:putative sterol carrier protein
MAVTCEKIFGSYSDRFQAETAGDWETVIQFVCEGEGGGKWVLTVADGKATVAEGEVDDPKATLTVPAEVWVGIHTGEVNPMMAFTQGQLKVTGNMGDVMKLNNPAVFKRMALE